MSTRCLIGKENKDKTITYIYCHFDGYESYVGHLLKDYYNNEERIDLLLSKGSASSLGKKVEDEDIDITKENKDGPKYELYSSFYYPSEELYIGQVENVEKFLGIDKWQDYLYLFKDGKWFIKSNSDLIDGKDFKEF